MRTANDVQILPHVLTAAVRSYNTCCCDPARRTGQLSWLQPSGTALLNLQRVIYWPWDKQYIQRQTDSGYGVHCEKNANSVGNMGVPKCEK
jgi:hypothetical protein